MSLISDLSQNDFVELQDNITERIAGCATLEDAAQQYVSLLYETLSDSIVMVRLFLAIPFSVLPEPNKEFVMDLAQSKDIGKLIKDKTVILSLLGTRGVKEDWNDRRKSQGHVGIPLSSAAFIGRVPMISRLLKQLGVGLDWINIDDTALVAETFESLSGVFYVRDAKTEVDSQGRKIIAAQDFVEAEGIRTVFGMGGGYLGTSQFFVTIFFLREILDKQTVMPFKIHANKIKAATLNLIDEGKLFS